LGSGLGITEIKKKVEGVTKTEENENNNRWMNDGQRLAKSLEGMDRTLHRVGSSIY
jgi:hypothetical protein